ncbi:MAG: radical SAM protein, partial [Acidobacteriota bacterium]|nr:radical SAM protein [Acidobacteriota bacterium]
MTFGPVPSRRLGQSLGINNIPPKICSYACIYCQLGRTLTMQTERTNFYDPERILEEVRTRVEEVRVAGESVDYLCFVPDGEPTLDLRLGREIELVRELGIKIAVITNSSLIWRKDVREELALADWVSLKVDAVREDVWRRIDRPHGQLRLSQILDGALALSGSFTGQLVTETML